MTQMPHSHILLMGRGGGGRVLEGFFGSEILVKRIHFFGSMKDVGIFWNRKKKKNPKNRDFFGYCSFHQLKSAITYQ